MAEVDGSSALAFEPEPEPSRRDVRPEDLQGEPIPTRYAEPEPEQPPKPEPAPFVGSPWERQPEESTRAWEAFVAYRDAGLKRTIRGVLEVIGRQPVYQRQLESFSSQHRWGERTRAWDVHVDALARAASEAEAASTVQLMQDVGRAILQKVSEYVATVTPANLSPNQAAQLAQAGHKLAGAGRTGPAAEDPDDLAAIVARIDGGGSEPSD